MDIEHKKPYLCAITVTVSARLIVRDRHADTQEAKKEVRRAARVKSWAPARINLSIKRVAAANSCVVLEIIHKWLCLLPFIWTMQSLNPTLQSIF